MEKPSYRHKNGIQLMMTMEDAIRKKLKEKYGTSAYYGKNSLVAAARDAVNDSSVNWNDILKIRHMLCLKNMNQLMIFGMRSTREI